MKAEKWGIMDDNGVIFTGSENEMVDMLFDIKNGGPARPIERWEGDLVLFEVKEVWNG